MPFTRSLLQAASILSLAACVTVSNTRSEPLSIGTSRTFGSDYSAVVTAASDAMAFVGLKVRDSSQVNDSTFMLIGQKTASLGSNAEFVRIVVQRAGVARTAVWVHTRRRSANVPAEDPNAARILSYMDFKLR